MSVQNHQLWADGSVLIIKLIFFRSHNFDTVQRQSNKPKRKSGIISSFGKPAEGAEGAKAFHEANEEKIMSYRRCGLNDEDLLY